MFVSTHQIAEGSTLLIANRSFENVGKFKYLGTIATKKKLHSLNLKAD
jgi:hypothetical protein